MHILVLVADTIARYKKLTQMNVLFVTGTDEHGQKVEEAAKKIIHLLKNL